MKYSDKEVEELRSDVAKILGISPSEVTLTQHEDGSFTVKAHGQEFTGTIEEIGAWAKKVRAELAIQSAKDQATKSQKGPK